MASKKILLQSSDGVTFELDEIVAMELKAIKSIIDDGDCANDVIPIPNITAKILSRVLEYCNKHFAAGNQGSSEADLKDWVADFMNVEQRILFETIVAANYLDYQKLLDLGCDVVAGMIRGKTVKEIRQTFNIENDLPPEKEKEIKRENRWAFDDDDLDFDEEDK